MHCIYKRTENVIITQMLYAKNTALQASVLKLIQQLLTKSVSKISFVGAVALLMTRLGWLLTFSMLCGCFLSSLGPHRTRIWWIIVSHSLGERPEPLAFALFVVTWLQARTRKSDVTLEAMRNYYLCHGFCAMEGLLIPQRNVGQCCCTLYSYMYLLDTKSLPKLLVAGAQLLQHSYTCLDNTDSVACTINCVWVL